MTALLSNDMGLGPKRSVDGAEFSVLGGVV